jgi:hypothetical protein
VITKTGTSSQPYGIELNGAGDMLELADKPLGTCTYIVFSRNRNEGVISTDTILSDSFSLGQGMRLHYPNNSEVSAWQYNTVDNNPKPSIGLTVDTDWDVFAVRVNYETRELSVSMLNDNKVHTTTATNAFVQSNDPLRIGASNGNGNDLFGSVSMFLMYDTYLTDAELSANYAAIKANQPSEIPPLP